MIGYENGYVIITDEGRDFFGLDETVASIRSGVFLDLLGDRYSKTHQQVMEERFLCARARSIFRFEEANNHAILEKI